MSIAVAISKDFHNPDILNSGSLNMTENNIIVYTTDQTIFIFKLHSTKSGPFSTLFHLTCSTPFTITLSCCAETCQDMTQLEYFNKRHSFSKFTFEFIERSVFICHLAQTP